MLADFEQGGDPKYIVDNLRQSMLVKQTFIILNFLESPPSYSLMPLSFAPKKFFAKLDFQT